MIFLLYLLIFKENHEFMIFYALLVYVISPNSYISFFIACGFYFFFHLHISLMEKKYHIHMDVSI